MVLGGFTIAGTDAELGWKVYTVNHAKMFFLRNSNGFDPNTFLGEQISIWNGFLNFWTEGSSASYNFLKLYSKSGEKTESDEHKILSTYQNCHLRRLWANKTSYLEEEIVRHFHWFGLETMEANSTRGSELLQTLFCTKNGSTAYQNCLMSSNENLFQNRNKMSRWQWCWC